MSFDRKTILRYRRLLKARALRDFEELPEGFQTDQQKNIPNPPLQKSYSKEAELLDLLDVEEFSVGLEHTLFDSLKNRRSHRTYTNDPLSLEELSYLLWASDGVHEVTKHHGSGTKRTVPSGGARHPYEIYLIINNVVSLKPGIYRYLAIEHKLLFLKSIEEIEQETLEKLTRGRARLILKGAVIFLFVAIPYRMEWRYSIRSHKVIAIEAGHLCQNLYLACEALNLGTCAIAAYNQKIADEIIGVDGDDEFTVYLAPVGKKAKQG